MCDSRRPRAQWDLQEWGLYAHSYHPCLLDKQSKNPGGQATRLRPHSCARDESGRNSVVGVCRLWSNCRSSHLPADFWGSSVSPICPVRDGRVTQDDPIRRASLPLHTCSLSRRSLPVQSIFALVTQSRFPRLAVVFHAQRAVARSVVPAVCALSPSCHLSLGAQPDLEAVSEPMATAPLNPADISR